MTWNASRAVQLRVYRNELQVHTAVLAPTYRLRYTLQRWGLAPAGIAPSLIPTSSSHLPCHWYFALLLCLQNHLLISSFCRCTQPSIPFPSIPSVLLILNTITLSFSSPLTQSTHSFFPHFVLRFSVIIVHTLLSYFRSKTIFFSSLPWIFCPPLQVCASPFFEPRPPSNPSPFHPYPPVVLVHEPGFFWRSFQISSISSPPWGCASIPTLKQTRFKILPVSFWLLVDVVISVFPMFSH